MTTLRLKPFRSLLVVVALVGGAARIAGAQVCSRNSVAVAPRQYSGARINSLTISTKAPDNWMARVPILGHLHSRTRANRIKAELLFAAGDSVDTLRIAESMRRLRSNGLFDRTELVVSACAGDPGVDLSVATRDAWTFTPIVKARSGSASVGFAERNAFGTGASTRMVMRSDHGNLGVGISMRSAISSHSRNTAEVGAVRYRNGQSLFGILGSRTISSADKSTIYLRTTFSEHEPLAQPGTNFQRSETSLLIGRRFDGGLSRSASYLLLGAEAEHDDLRSQSTSRLLGSQTVRRSYAGINLGLARVAATYDTVSWLLSSGGIVDVPSGIEGEVVGGVGRDRITAHTAQHLDLWAGRTFLSRSHRSILLADVWASGFAGDDRLSASTLRSSWTLFHNATRGYWTVRLTGEHLGNPDPDLLALATTDFLAPALPRDSKLAEGALAFSAERTFHLLPVSRSLVLDAAAFGGASYRWDAATTAATNSFGAFVAGAGLRLSPSRTARSSIRLDFGIPFSKNGSVNRTPYVALSVMTWPFFDRQRDGRKTP